MGLYHKQLNSVADLRRERKRIKKNRKIARDNAAAVEQAKSADTNPMAAFMAMAGDLFASKTTKNVMGSVAMPLFQMALGRTKNGLLKRVAKELLGGYIKWKAIDFGVTLAMRFIRTQKHKTEKNTPQY